MRRVGRIVTGIGVRAAAIVGLLLLLIAVPVAVSALVGTPWPSAEQLRVAWRTGLVDDATVVRIGATLFLVLWAWFAATALAEAARVVRARRTAPGRRVVLPAAPSSPSGWIQRLVRVALISTTALASTALRPAPTTARAGEAAVLRGPVAAVTAPAEPQSSPLRAQAFISSGRDTPYSVASRLGDASLRAPLIELNRGRPTPSGAPWVGGVFPAGMDVALPPGMLPGRSVTWSTYTVEPGDSVYAIAAGLVANDDRRVVDVADQMIERNLGRTMNDGRRFTDPSLILPGWVLDVPVVDGPAADSVTSAPGAGFEHVVVEGESYWAIADAHLRATGSPSGPADVAGLVRLLRDANAPRLGHDHPDMLHPGDVVVLPTAGSAAPGAPTPEPVEPAPVAEPVPLVEPAPVSAPSEPAGPAAETAPSATPPPVDVDAPVPEPTSPITSAPVTTSPGSGSPATTFPVITATEPVGTTGDTAHPGPADVRVLESADRRSNAPAVGIASTLLLGAGALALLETRRRHQLRRAVVGARLEPPTDRAIATETLLRSLDASERTVRLDLAVRSAAAEICAQDRHILGALMTPSGEITLLLDSPATPPTGPWRAGATDSSWLLPATVSVLELAPAARPVAQPCPALIHLGVAQDEGRPLGDLFLDVEAIGLLCIDGPQPETVDVLHAVGASLAASPLSETLHVVTTGLDESTHLGNLHVESADSLGAALDLAATAHRSTRASLAGMRTFAVRARGTAGEAWEPTVVVAASCTVADADALRLRELCGSGGEGTGVVVGARVDGAEWTVRHRDGSVWMLAPLGLEVVPAAIPTDEVRALHDLLDAADRPAPVDLDVPVTEPRDDVVGPETADAVTGDFEEPPWTLMVRVLGQVDVVDRDGRAVPFERGKALELAVWLSQHRGRSTRAGARTALWDLDVRDATFANVVSDARRAMARAAPPPEGEQWIERTLTEDLPMHRLVVTDADLLRARVDACRSLPPENVLDLLRPGLELVRDMPLAGTGWLWPDAQGITSSLTLLATSAATQLARAYLDLGDIEGVFWATGQGLKVLYGHEELIALRMRAHARCGDLAGVRNEWEVYERALTADPWSDGEPSPKLVEIRRELLR